MKAVILVKSLEKTAFILGRDRCTAKADSVEETEYLADLQGE